MKKFLLCFCFAAFLCSCNSADKEKTAYTTKEDNATKATTDLPYKANYSSSFNTDVSDADLKMVLTTYKDWSDANLGALSKSMGDSVTVEMSSGEVFKGTNADLMKKWSTYRDSLSSVKIDMTAWQKMYATDKKDSMIVTWYDETDTYKNGKVDSASYHDINLVKNGKIVWYSQYKRPKK
jgi:hypothetical protein